MRNKTRKWREPTITGRAGRGGNTRLGTNSELPSLTVRCGCVAKQNVPVIWFITDDVNSPLHSPPPRIHLHFRCACNKSPERINAGLGTWLQYLFFARESKSVFGGKTGSSISETLITVPPDTNSHWPLLLSQKTGPWKNSAPGKIGPRGEGGREWCQTSRARRSTWGFNDISVVRAETGTLEGGRC